MSCQLDSCPSLLVELGQRYRRRSTVVAVAQLATPSRCGRLDDVQYTFLWTVEAVTHGDITSQLASVGVTLSKPTLAIKGSLLTSDTWYRLNITATPTAGSGRPTLRQSSLIYMEVSPVVAVISGANVRSHSVNKELVLDGASSFDPDFVAGSGATYTYSWSCQRRPSGSADAVPYTNCASELSSVVTSLSSLTVPAGALTTARRYRFSLVYSKLVGSQPQSTATAEAFVETVFTDLAVAALPTINMAPVEGLNAQPGRSQRVRLLASASSTATPPTSPALLVYRWSDRTQYPNSKARKTGPLNLTDPNIIASIPNRPELVIQSGVLDSGVNYVFRVEVAEPTSVTSTSMAEATFALNGAPSGGRLVVNELSGEAFGSLFRVSAPDWTDVDAPLAYSFAFSELPSSQEVLLTEMVTTNSAVVMLPAGQIQLIVYVHDSQGATARAVLPSTVTVTPPSRLTHTCVLERVANASNTTLANLMSQQDYATSTLMVQWLARELNREADSLDVSPCLSLPSVGGSARSLSQQRVAARRKLAGLLNAAWQDRFQSGAAMSQSIRALQTLTDVPAEVDSSIATTTYFVWDKLLELRKQRLKNDNPTFLLGPETDDSAGMYSILVCLALLFVANIVRCVFQPLCCPTCLETQTLAARAIKL